jgi:formylglycine-generating enzyme required for sulfatase activity
VGQKAANLLGLHDMSGNVWEWCWDWSISTGTVTDPSGASSGATRVMRGGSWSYMVSGCTVSARGNNPPDFWNDDIGFRVCESVPAE